MSIMEILSKLFINKDQLAQSIIEDSRQPRTILSLFIVIISLSLAYVANRSVRIIADRAIQHRLLSHVAGCPLDVALNFKSAVGSGCFTCEKR